MSPRTKIPLPFTAGLDRASGQEVVSPRAMADARNCYARSASALALRPGMAPTPYPVLAFGTSVVGEYQLRATKDILLVVFDAVTRKLRLYRVNPIAIPTLQAVLVDAVADWGTLNASASFPHVTFAEEAGSLFIAHDEPSMTYRLNTIYYTPNVVDATVGAATSLSADLNASGAPHPVKFRGVVGHVDALWGWGYGTFADADEPHIMHVSDPGDPFTFRPEGYFLAGVKGDPIIGAAPVGSVLAVRKPTTGHRITGAGADTYAIEPSDAIFGAEAPRLVIAVGSDAYTWSAAGPRKLTLDGGSIDMALPLDLPGPSPATLQAMGVTADGFAIYDPNTRVLEFCFPDLVTAPGKTRCYACSLVNPIAPQWTYFERQVTACCAALIDPTKGAPAAVTAYASGVTVTDVGIQSGNMARQLLISFTQNAQAGDEQWQVFTRRQSTLTPALPYALVTTIGATARAVVTATLLNIPPLAAYDVAIRATRSGAVLAGYEASDPSGWVGATVAGAKASGATSCGVPIVTSALWQRNSPTTGQLNVVFSLDDTTAPVLMQQSPDGVTWTTIATLVAGERSYAYPISGATIGTTQHVRAWPSRTENGVTVNGTASVDTLAVCGFTGVPTILDQWYSFNATYPASNLGVMLWMQHAPAATQVEVQTSPDNVAWTTVFSGSATSRGFQRFDASTTPGGLVVPAIPTPGYVRARNGMAGSGGAIDFGAWSASSALAAYSNAAAAGAVFAVAAPLFVAPRSANDTASGIAAVPGSRLAVLFLQAAGSIPVAVRVFVADGTQQTPLPTSVSGLQVNFVALAIAPGNYDISYTSAAQGISP